MCKHCPALDQRRLSQYEGQAPGSREFDGVDDTNARPSADAGHTVDDALKVLDALLHVVPEQERRRLGRGGPHDLWSRLSA
jgi:hypothetical protein